MSHFKFWKEEEEKERKENYKKRVRKKQKNKGIKKKRRRGDVSSDNNDKSTFCFHFFLENKIEVMRKSQSFGNSKSTTTEK